MPLRPLAAFALMAFALAPTASVAVFSGDMSPRAESGDPDYAAAVRAKARGDWPEMAASLQRVIANRPWHDNAHNLLGYAYRHMDQYDLALEHYHKAIELNPRHRGAYEYLGRAHLQMGCPTMARETLDQLRQVCQTVALTFSDGDFTDGCREYRHLAQAIAYFEEHGEAPPEE